MVRKRLIIMVNVPIKSLVSKFTALAKAVATFVSAALAQVKSAKLMLAEIAGAAAALFGIGGLTGWQYSAIIGGLAVILAIERQPKLHAEERVLTAKAVALAKALRTAKANGTVNVLVDDILKIL
jgi:hypothetical protein